MPTCPACALGNHPAARFCSRCGAAMIVAAPLPVANNIASFSPYAHLEGISGWLILIAISLVSIPFFVVRNAILIDLPILKHGTVGGSLIGLLFLLKNATILFALVLLNWLFYTKNRVFPKSMIAFHLGMLGVHVLEHVAYAALSPQSAVPYLSRPVLSSILSCLIWISYLLISRRVKATFIR
jgi:hypothetical protein